jgi:hypothetical protein
MRHFHEGVSGPVACWPVRLSSKEIPVVTILIASKNVFRPAKTKYSVLYHADAPRQQPIGLSL